MKGKSKAPSAPSNFSRSVGGALGCYNLNMTSQQLNRGRLARRGQSYHHGGRISLWHAGKPGSRGQHRHAECGAGGQERQELRNELADQPPAHGIAATQSPRGRALGSDTPEGLKTLISESGSAPWQLLEQPGARGPL
jgi:hypothetical protein